MKENGMDYIPEKYIVHRWRKNIKIPEVGCSSTTKGNKENPYDRFQNIAKQFYRYVNVGCTSVELYDSCMRALDEVFIKWSKENNFEVITNIFL